MSETTIKNLQKEIKELSETTTSLSEVMVNDAPDYFCRKHSDLNKKIKLADLIYFVNSQQNLQKLAQTLPYVHKLNIQDQSMEATLMNFIREPEVFPQALLAFCKDHKDEPWVIKYFTNIVFPALYHNFTSDEYSESAKKFIIACKNCQGLEEYVDYYELIAVFIMRSMSFKRRMLHCFFTYASNMQQTNDASLLQALIAAFVDSLDTLNEHQLEMFKSIIPNDDSEKEFKDKASLMMNKDIFTPFVEFCSYSSEFIGTSYLHTGENCDFQAYFSKNTITYDDYNLLFSVSQTSNYSPPISLNDVLYFHNDVLCLSYLDVLIINDLNNKLDESIKINRSLIELLDEEPNYESLKYAYHIFEVLINMDIKEGPIDEYRKFEKDNNIADESTDMDYDAAQITNDRFDQKWKIIKSEAQITGVDPLEQIMNLQGNLPVDEKEKFQIFALRTELAQLKRYNRLSEIMRNRLTVFKVWEDEIDFANKYLDHIIMLYACNTSLPEIKKKETIEGTLSNIRLAELWNVFMTQKFSNLKLKPAKQQAILKQFAQHQSNITKICTFFKSQFQELDIKIACRRESDYSCFDRITQNEIKEYLELWGKYEYSLRIRYLNNMAIQVDKNKIPALPIQTGDMNDELLNVCEFGNNIAISIFIGVILANDLNCSKLGNALVSMAEAASVSYKSIKVIKSCLVMSYAEILKFFFARRPNGKPEAAANEFEKFGQIVWNYQKNLNSLINDHQVSIPETISKPIQRLYDWIFVDKN